MLALALACPAAASIRKPQQHPFTVTPADGVRPAVIERVEELAGASLVSLRKVLPPPRRHFWIRVHATSASLPEAIRSSLHEGTAGLAVLPRSEIHILMAAIEPSPPNDLRTVVRHEIVHILLDQLAGAAGPWVPRWIHEGIAQELSGATYLGASEEDIVLLAVSGNLPSFSALRERFPHSARGRRIAYAQSHSFVAYLVREVGFEPLLNAVRGCRADRRFREVFLAETGRPLASYEHDWVEYLRHGSGASLRLLLTSCFSLALVAALPLLVLAGSRRWNRDHAARQRLELEEKAEESQ